MGMKLASLAIVMLLGGVAHADAPRPRGQLRQLLLQHFDRNGDGQLQPRERKQAARALHRIAKRLAKADRRRPQVRRQQHDGHLDIWIETDDLQR
jgi:hypothetical protein